jgi:glycosyltransferase involved in cell wall biosynthesis
LVHSSSGRYGADRQLHLIATGLDPDRFSALVVLPERGPLADDLQAAGVEVVLRPLGVLRRSLASVTGLSSISAAVARDSVALGRLVRQRGVALVHSNTSVVIGGALAAAATRRPHVWHVREIYSRFTRPWPLYRRALRSARALPCVSAATAAQFGGPSDRVRVIYDGLAIDPQRADPGLSRRALDIDPEVPTIAMLGRISDWKGQDVLVRALAEPPLRERGVIGLIAGEVWPGAEHRREQVLELAETLRVDDRLRLVGFRDDVGTIYGAADVVAVPSTAPDPLPGAAIEAAAAGCAVIASDHGGLPEIIRDGETGRLVAPSDPRPLAQAAAELLDDPSMRERLGIAAAADARSRFAPDRLLHAIQSLYDEFLTQDISP